MKKVLIALVLLVIGTSARAQTFEALGNVNIVAGYTYQTSEPLAGSRGALMLSANVAAAKPFPDIPVYFGGFGVALPTSVESVASQFGNFVVGTIPVITWYPRGNEDGTFWSKVLLQAGYSRVIVGDTSAKNGFYGAIGYGWDSPAFLKYKREVKQAKKAGRKSTLKNPYDVQ